MFVGRKKEIAYLEELYRKNRTDILCLYGHRGVGKTSLVLSFAANKSYYYYEARPVSDELAVEIACREAGKEVDENNLYGSFFESITYSEGSGDKKVLVIDEFQNIIKNDEAFIKALIEYTDSIEEQVLVIFISSSISFVENGLVPKIGQYARMFSGFYKLAPLAFFFTLSFTP